jgi:hypothetical protein
MGPERHGSKIDGNANYRHVLSSERALHLRISTFPDEVKIEILVTGRKGKPDAKIDWPSDRRP